ncbi:MAG: glycosyltransferase [Muribaculaceae bacterium]|nr:glycosyltransferase [Muribaculaceae bacterium]
MRISVVIPTFNGEKYIAEAIESVLSQTRAADEIIVSDDNSSDSTLEICSRYASEIKIVTNPTGPSGFVGGWNNAIAHATGDYVSVLHQDDLLAPTFLEEIERAIGCYPDVGHFFVLSNAINEKGVVIRTAPEVSGEVLHQYSGGEYVRAYLHTPGNLHRCPGVVTARRLFAQCAYREEAGHIADDDFFYRIGNFTDIVGIHLPLASYREHTGSETGHLSELQLALRLLNDYNFQLNHTADNPLLNNDIIQIFKDRELQFCHRVIIYALRTHQSKELLYGLRRWLSFAPQHGNLRHKLKHLVR